MPGFSRHTLRPDVQPIQTSQTGDNALQPRGNDAAQQALKAERDAQPAGLLHLCMQTSETQASSCMSEGMNAATLHGWIAFEEDGGERQSWGLWPGPESDNLKGGVVRAVLDGVPGEVKTPDPKDKGSINATQTFEITKGEQVQLRSWIASNLHWTYHFGVSNCVHWAQEAVRSTGNTPATSKTAGIANPIQCPSDTIRGIEQQNAAQGRHPQGMHKDPVARSEVAWKNLSGIEKAAWTRLGYTEATWEAGGTAFSEDTDWADLDDKQKAAATELGYTAATWDAS